MMDLLGTFQKKWLSSSLFLPHKCSINNTIKPLTSHTINDEYETIWLVQLTHCSFIY